MNRRGFLRAVGATGLLLAMQGPAVWAAGVSKLDRERLIRQALAECRLVQFKYHGYRRRVEPHALGHVTGDRLALLGWQVSGGSASEPPPGWRTFVVAEISGLELTRATFMPRPDYDAATAKLKPVEVEISRQEETAIK